MGTDTISSTGIYVPREFLEKHKADLAETKRDHMVINNTEYILHTRPYNLFDLRDQEFEGCHGDFRAHCKNSAYSTMRYALVVTVERTKNQEIRSKGTDELSSSLVLDSAVLSKIRFKSRMEAFAQAVLGQTGKEVDQLPVDDQLFVYLAMYATKPFSRLSRFEHKHELVGGLPINDEVSVFLVW